MRTVSLSFWKCYISIFVTVLSCENAGHMSLLMLDGYMENSSFSGLRVVTLLL